ncbi:MAG: hypothetical protein ACREBR_05780 [bacterium]
MADLPINSSDAQPVNITDPVTQTLGAGVTANNELKIMIPSVATTGTITSTTSVTAPLSALNSRGAIGIVITGVWVATLEFEGSVDGVNFSSIIVFPSVSGTGITSTTANGTWFASAAGLNSFRVRASAFTSGTVTVSFQSSEGDVTVFTPASGGVGSNVNIHDASGANIILGQKTMANSVPVVLPSDQTINVSVSPSTKAAYGMTTRSIAPAVAATDIVTISGSASKTITVTRIELTTNTTSTSFNNWIALKRSTVNTGGTSTSPTIVPYDSNNAAGTAVVHSYSANPTALGTLVGNLKMIKLFSPPPTGGNATNENVQIFDFTDGGVISGVVLRGTGQLLCLNFAGAAVPAGMVIAVNIDWIES